MMRLADLDGDRYVRDVLPLTASLWANGRTFEKYVDHTREIARSAYGRRSYRTIGLIDGSSLVASCKQYQRTLRLGERRLQAFGFGAVFTPPAFRGHGYASALLGMLLDRGRERGHHLAFLFSDIHPQFYRALGFEELPSRAISLRASSLPSARIEVANVSPRDWTGIRRCFEACSARSTFGFVRTPLIWDWVRLRLLQGSEHDDGQAAHLVVRRGRSVAAYVFGVRQPREDAYVIDEFGFLDEDTRPLVAPLLRSASGDLRRIVGWLPPPGAREALPRGSLRKRRDAILMIAPLTPSGKRFLAAAQAPSSCDAVWATDHI